MAYEQIRYEVEGAVATLTLSRPERLNAWTYQMSGELVDAIERVNADTDSWRHRDHWRGQGILRRSRYRRHFSVADRWRKT